ncbi:MAG: hypothetical protein A2Y12_10235 [Planctomycetes bacterium GWF2_42_9]|nr:MAG: hypothetical protein A2Y12_10235 [Planctomycetes bacterium GWF2_42_9]HAL45961.1 hypothetical protein [Phycisphaerales bacterium]
MFEAIEYYQSLAEKFDSRVMCVPALAVILVGLCIWLSGLRWRKVLGAIAGGTMFAGIGFCLGDYGVVIFIITIIGMAVGAMIEKVMLGVFGVAMTCAAVLVIISAFLASQNTSEYPHWPQYEQSGVVIGFSQMIEITKATGSYIVSNMIENLKSASLLWYGAIMLAVIAAGFLAVVMPRLFIAFISSSLGSAVIFAGLMMLLFYKGSKPVNYISKQAAFYAFIIFVMLVFGTMVQLVLSPAPAEQKPSPEKKADKK